jgi:hypothetical protein
MHHRNLLARSPRRISGTGQLAGAAQNARACVPDRYLRQYQMQCAAQKTPKLLGRSIGTSRNKKRWLQCLVRLYRFHRAVNNHLGAYCQMPARPASVARSVVIVIPGVADLLLEAPANLWHAACSAGADAVNNCWDTYHATAFFVTRLSAVVPSSYKIRPKPLLTLQLACAGAGLDMPCGEHFSSRSVVWKHLTSDGRVISDGATDLCVRRGTGTTRLGALLPDVKEPQALAACAFQYKLPGGGTV